MMTKTIRHLAFGVLFMVAVFAGRATLLADSWWWVQHGCDPYPAFPAFGCADGEVDAWCSTEMEGCVNDPDWCPSGSYQSGSEVLCEAYCKDLLGEFTNYQGYQVIGCSGYWCEVDCLCIPWFYCQ
jgi:hypothetical protein